MGGLTDRKMKLNILTTRADQMVKSLTGWDRQTDKMAARSPAQTHWPCSNASNLNTLLPPTQHLCESGPSSDSSPRHPHGAQSLHLTRGTESKDCQLPGP